MKFQLNIEPMKEHMIFIKQLNIYFTDCNPDG